MLIFSSAEVVFYAMFCHIKFMCYVDGLRQIQL